MRTYNDPMAETRPNRAQQRNQSFEPIPLKPKFKLPGLSWWLFFGVVLFLVYLFFPTQSVILVLGIDRAFENTAIGRSDTNILLSVRTLSGEVRAFSVPRDLWVPIPNYGENRINAAHYFGEGEQPGGGPRLAVQTFEKNFEIEIDHYVRIQLEQFPQLVDALGGIDIQLEKNMAGYPPGTHHLDGEQALVFVRNRAGSDDFFRMEEGQVFIKAVISALSNPRNLLHLPSVFVAGAMVVDTDIPTWQMPRLAVALLRAGASGIQFETINRDMVTPWVTDAGAQVLLPNWAVIKPRVWEMISP